MICCPPSRVSLATPPRASAAHRVPSGSARMHSGRCRPLPTYRIEDLSSSKLRSGLTIIWKLRSLFRVLFHAAHQDADLLSCLAYLIGISAEAVFWKTRHRYGNSNRSDDHIIFNPDRRRHAAEFFTILGIVDRIAAFLRQSAVLGQGRETSN